MFDFFNITEILITYGYFGIFIIVFLESGIFFPLPGDSLLFTAGLFASAFSLDILILIPLIFVATFLGGLAGYEIGANLEKLRQYALFRKILKKEHIDKAHTFFDKYGVYAIVFSRFVPIVRTFLPIIAGVAKVDYKFFLKYSLISSLLWSTIVTSLGYFLGRIFPQIKDYLHIMVILIVVVSVLPMAYEILKKKNKA
ncbi:MAG TPA: DedA family protein [Candidatus Paceibacterota bacterium]